jgi:hypothetical protein
MIEGCAGSRFGVQSSKSVVNKAAPFVLRSSANCLMLDAAASVGVNIGSDTLTTLGRWVRAGNWALLNAPAGRLVVSFNLSATSRAVASVGPRPIGAQLAGNAEIGAREGHAKLRDKLIHRVGLVVKALAELANAARLGACEMG